MRYLNDAVQRYIKKGIDKSKKSQQKFDRVATRSEDLQRRANFTLRSIHSGMRILTKLARSRLYRRHILQVNMRLKALAEIYTMHSFALLCNRNFLSNMLHLAKFSKFSNISEIFGFSFCKILANFQKNMWLDVIGEQCKGVHRVDLGKSFQTHIYLQNLASIQPRTSPLSLPHAFERAL